MNGLSFIPHYGKHWQAAWKPTAMRLRDFGAVDQRFAGSSGFAGIVGLRQNKLLFSLPGPQYAQELENGAQSLPLWGIGGMCAAGESWQDAARRHGEADTGCSVKLFSSRETYYLNINSDIYAVDVDDVPAPALLYAAAFRPPDNPYGDLQTVYGVEYFAHLQGTPQPGEDVAALLALGQPLLVAASQQALTLDNLLQSGAELFANPDYPALDPSCIVTPLGTPHFMLQVLDSGHWWQTLSLADLPML